MVSMDDILARREDIRRVLAKHGGHDPYVFGSVVRGEQGEKSDVDILVRLDDDRSLLDQIALKHELEDLLGCEVDVVEDAALQAGIREAIQDEIVAI